VLAVLDDEMRCVHYDRLTSGGPSSSNWSRGSRFANDAPRSNHVDLIGPLPISAGFTYCLTAVER
jgi:hypothetical protein